MAEHSAVAVAPTRLRLLGGWQLWVDGIERDLGHREQRLVAFLGLVERSARAQVASALWPDSTDERALASLRRAVLQCQRRCPGLLDADRMTIALAPAVVVDVDDLRRACGLTRLPMTDAVARELLSVLRGDELLPGWYDDWAVGERARFERLRVEALEQVARHGLEHGDLELAVEAARAASEIEPMREAPREVSIRARLGLGDIGGALHEFHRYRSVMRDELGVAPAARIAALVEPLLEKATRPASPPTPPRQRAAPVEEELARVGGPAPDDGPAWAPTTSLDDFLDGRQVGPRGGLRRAGAALVGVAGVALAVSLTMALAGPDEQQATGDPGASGLVDRVPAAAPRQDPLAPGRTVRVRTVAAVRGTAVFAVRADQRPAQVRLVVRGRAGLRVVRHLVVRDATGRDVVVEGLDPGTYTWSATSASAAPVSGEVSVAAPATEAPRPAPPSASVTTVVTQVAATPSSTAEPNPQQTSSPTPTPSPTPSPTPHPTPTSTPTPTGTPRDPGTVAPPPVG